MSHFEKYISIANSPDSTLFEFTSVGPKGKIKMVVQFAETERKDLFNLGFGSLRDDGSIDDLAINDNKDRNKILATVAATVYDFTLKYPDKSIAFTGSTKERTRLYRMALALNYDELSKSFVVFGLTENLELEFFQKGKTYNGFLVKRK